MVSSSEWNSMQETLHLLGSPRNAAALLESIALEPDLLTLKRILRA
jgi:PHD/YefM family antitoxin component YafN of YafNO toxin-antitoxin module